MRDSYLSLRDSLRAVSGRSAILQRDIRSASAAVLLSRARGLDAACSASLRQLDRARSPILDSELASRVPSPRRTALDRSYIELRATLTTCASEYRGMSRMDKADEMRARGVNLAFKNQQAVRNFEAAAEPFLQGAGIRVRPHGAGANPYAGSSRGN
jgi:hypothetical protein